MGYIEDVFQYEDQLGALWEVRIIPKKSSNVDSKILTFKTQEMTIPFFRFKVERQLSGLIPWMGVEDLNELSITLRESVDFSTIKFFEELKSKIYDYKERRFLVQKNENDYLVDIEASFFKPGSIEQSIEWRNADLWVKNQTWQTQTIYDEPSIKIIYKNCKLIGFDNLNLSYTGGEAIVYSVTLMPETYEIK